VKRGCATPGVAVFVDMDTAALTEVATLLRSRNAIDERIASIIGRPALTGHLGEWLAAEVFDIQLETSASAKAIDGRFRSGPLAGKTVNIKTYGKREGILDTTDHPSLAYYLVLCGPKATAMTSKGGTRPWAIENVYLFDAAQLRADQVQRGIKSGVASSVRNELWSAAEIYPRAGGPALLTVTAEQVAVLARFKL
jgi:hypothetical protein